MYRRAAAVAALILSGAAPSLSGQESEAELLRRIDSLAPLVDQAAMAAAAVRAERMEAARLRAATERSLDTIRVADMTIIAPVADADAARRLFAEVWSESFSGFTSRSLPEGTFTYQRAAYDVEEILVDGPRHQVVVATWHSRGRAKARIRNAVGRAIAAELGYTELGRWTRGDPFTHRDPARMYRELVASRSVGVRRCLEGEAKSCAVALGLGLGDDVLDEWYTPLERRERVLTWAGFDPTSRQRTVPDRWTDLYGPAFARCVEMSSADACDVFVDPELDAWAPLPAYMRDTLVGLALQRGGAGAWSRLLEDPTMRPEEALTYAAGIPLDELVAEWRTWIVDNRPRVYAGLGGSSVGALLWALLFAAFAARSTRWRFG